MRSEDYRHTDHPKAVWASRDEMLAHGHCTDGNVDGECDPWDEKCSCSCVACEQAKNDFERCPLMKGCDYGRGHPGRCLANPDGTVY